jgi:hypothetical protein
MLPACTDEWRTITINLDQSGIEDYYTLRLNTGDTIRIGMDNIISEGTSFPVLDDGFKDILGKDPEPFRFEAVKEGEIRIRQNFLIKSDGCHVILVQGPGNSFG